MGFFFFLDNFDSLNMEQYLTFNTLLGSTTAGDENPYTSNQLGNDE